MKAPAEPDDVSISLSQDEALVLFEWLTAYNNKSEPQLADQAEQRVLCDVEAKLMRRSKHVRGASSLGQCIPVGAPGEAVSPTTGAAG